MHRKQLMMRDWRRSHTYRQLRNSSPATASKLSRQATVIGGKHETLNRLAINESIYNLRHVRDGDAPVEKVIGFD